MKVSAICFLSALLAAAPGLALPAVDAGLTTNAQSCTPGKYYCADTVSGGKTVCKSCAIATGNSLGQCTTSAFCTRKDGSCVTNNGNPYCT